MGDASFNKGGVAARNLKAGNVSVDDSQSVSFDRPMKNTPEVVATANGTDANVYVSAVDQNGFTLEVTGDGTADVSWMAFNDDRA